MKTDGAPFRGPDMAPVTIVEFQDFHCPFCRRVQPTLIQLAARYGDRVKLFYRDFPIDSLHPQARDGHESARCANAHGSSGRITIAYSKPHLATPEDFKAIARPSQGHLEIGAFDLCMNARIYRSTVQRDIDEGARLGVTGTPTFFINGRVISGAQPLDSFTRIVDEALARSNWARQSVPARRDAVARLLPAD